MEEKKFNRFRYAMILSVVMSGSGSTILINIQLERYSYYPLFQSIIMFTGELIASFFLLHYLKSSDVQSNQSTLLNPDQRPRFFSVNGKIIYSFLAVLDMIGSWIENYSLQYMNPADFLSLKMVGIIYMVLYRVLIQKRKVYRHQYLGFALFAIGILILMIDNFVVSYKGKRMSYGFYIALILIAQLLISAELVLLEYFTWKNNANSFEVNSIKGLSGLIISGLAYLPLSFLFNGHERIYSIDEPFKKIFLEGFPGPILVVSLVLILCIYNIVLVQYVKMTEAFSFKCIDSGRIIIVSIILSALSFSKLKGSVAVQAVSAVCVFTGLIIYNEILILPFFGLSKSAKLSISENKILKQKRAEQRTWIHKLDELVDMQNKTRELNNF